MPNLNLRLGWETNRLSRRRRRGGRNWKSAESFGAGTSSSPLAHVPGLRQELWRRKEIRSTSVHISLSLWGTTHCPPHVYARLPASLGAPRRSWSGMDEGMIRAMRRYLTEGGGVGEGQAVVVGTHWEQVPWAGEEARRFWICEGVALLDE